MPAVSRQVCYSGHMDQLQTSGGGLIRKYNATREQFMNYDVTLMMSYAAATNGVGGTCTYSYTVPGPPLWFTCLKIIMLAILGVKICNYGHSIMHVVG